MPTRVSAARRPDLQPLPWRSCKPRRLHVQYAVSELEMTNLEQAQSWTHSKHRYIIVLAISISGRATERHDTRWACFRDIGLYPLILLARPTIYQAQPHFSHRLAPACGSSCSDQASEYDIATLYTHEPEVLVTIEKYVLTA